MSTNIDKEETLGVAESDIGMDRREFLGTAGHCQRKIIYSPKRIF
jgi:hypothetical protein